MTEKVTMSVSEVSQALGICTALAYRKIREGEIPSIKLGDRYLIPVIQFRRYLAGECESPATQVRAEVT